MRWVPGTSFHDRVKANAKNIKNQAFIDHDFDIPHADTFASDFIAGNVDELRV
jgi:hypothetical protein